MACLKDSSQGSKKTPILTPRTFYRKPRGSANSKSFVDYVMSSDPHLPDFVLLGFQATVLYNQAFAKSQDKLTHYEEECMRLSSEADKLRALFTKKKEELRDLKAHLETMSRERTDLAEQLEKKDILMREGLRARDIEVLGLKQHVDEIASARDTLQGKLTLAEHHLHDARADSSKYKDLHAESVAALFAVKSEDDALISSYREDAATANAGAKKVSEVAELELTRALEHDRLRSRR
uniref:Intracellular protein transport protein USO1-like n=2 Tax=Nicotiana sylvestris TaxID=4096 RepID=A0A1U7X7J8_NICSY|nr:PREDICTED: intracellular protein transport protein USO1-like [Nicotiana sylvestris]